MKQSCFLATRAVLGAVLLGVCGASSPVGAQAQAAPLATPDGVHTRTLALRNVKPSIVAFWLDPVHHRAPEEVREGSSLIQQNVWATPSARLPGNGNGPQGLQLPEGIKSIVPVDMQNGLVVSGTNAGLDALEKLLSSLDVPLVQFELEACFYRIDLADLSALGLKFDPSPEETPYGFGSVSGLPADYQGRFVELEAAKRVGILSVPRVTTIDGLGGEAKQTSTRPVSWNEKAPLPHLAGAVKDGRTAQRFAHINNSNSLRSTVTRIEGGLIEVVVEPHLGTRVLSVEATVREEEPFAIQMSPSTDARQLIVVVTVHRVRRLSE